MWLRFFISMPNTEDKNIPPNPTDSTEQATADPKDQETKAPADAAASTVSTEETPAAPQEFSVNKKGFIEAEGEIDELLPGLKFRVKLDNGHEIIATMAGRMRMNRIQLVFGDRVKIEMSPYDMTKGRITYRK